MRGFEGHRPARKRVFVHPVQTFDNRDISEGFTKPSRHQLVFKTSTTHRPSGERRFDPPHAIGPVIQVSQRGQPGDDLFDVPRWGAATGEKTFDLTGRAVESGEIPHSTVEPLVRRLRNAPFHRSALQTCGR